MDLRDLYEDIILDHNRNPRNFRHAPDPESHRSEGNNPLCGDDVVVRVRVADGKVADIGFEGRGCAISTASASLMTEAVKGMSVEEAEALAGKMRDFLTDGAPLDDEDAIGELIALGGVKDYPMRVKCATLAWHTLRAALAGDGAPVTTE